MSDYADTGTSREGDPYAEIAALRQRVAELEAQLQCASRAFKGAKQSFLEQGKAHLRKIATLTRGLEAARKAKKGRGK